MADNEDDEIVQYVEITNLHHHPQNLNGFYIATETTREDRFVYKKDNSSIILWFYYFTDNKSLCNSFFLGPLFEKEDFFKWDNSFVFGLRDDI